MITTLDIAMLTFMKKLTKEQIEKRKRIKQYLLRSLHIVSYILSALFIIVCIAVGVQSCNGKKQINKVNRDFENNLRADSQLQDFAYTYTSKYSGTSTEISLSTQEQLLKSCDSSLSIYTAYSSYYDYTFDYSLNEVYAFKTDINQFVPIISTHVHFRTYTIGSDYYWRFLSIYFVADFGTSQSGFGYCNKVFNTDETIYNNLYYNFDSWWVGPVYNKLYCSDNSINNNPVFNLFFTQNIINSDSFFTFDDTFNYNSLFQYNVALDPNNTGIQTITQNLSYYRFNEYNGYLSYSINANSYTLTYELPFFISNGQLFNRIVVSYVALADGEKVQTLQAGLITNHKVNGINTTLIYRNMRYVNSLSNVSIEVNKRSGALDSSGTYVYYLSTFWNNNDFKTLYFLSDLDEYQSLLFKNINNVLNGSINPNTGNIYNVFDLMTLAFSSIGNFLTIQILPSISLGLLMFIPLVVTLIIVVFRLVKK